MQNSTFQFLIDTHCHLEMLVQPYQASTTFQRLTPEQYQTLQNVVNQAEKKNVKKLITIGTTYDRSLQGIEISKRYDHIFSTIGIHPCDITTSWKNDLKKLAQHARNKNIDKIIGIGETGLDFYHPGFDAHLQKEVFRAHIEIALEHDLTLIVHSRSAIDETLHILQEYKKNNSPLRGIIHCFGESLAIAQDIQKIDFMMGISAIITYPKNQELRAIVKKFELNNMVLETDSPFLPPQTLRGQQNNPAHVHTIAEFIAQEVLNWSFEKVTEKTTANAEKIFKF